MVDESMPRKIMIYMVALLFATPLFAQFDFPAMNGRGAGMGDAVTALDDRESAMYNIAALAHLDGSVVATGFRQSFMAKGMGYFSLGAATPVGFGSGAVTLVHFGNSDYNEQCASLSYGISLGESISMGVSFHYLHSGTSDPYYEPLNRVTFSLALQYAPTEAFLVGFRAFNPVAVVSDDERSLRVPALFNLGFSYKIMEDLLAVAEVEKNLYQLATLRFGLEYIFVEDYAFRVGINTQPVIYTFGFGLRKDHFGVDIAAEFHNVLGFTPQMSLNYKF